jgi:hypothetical protein
LLQLPFVATHTVALAGIEHHVERDAAALQAVDDAE